MVNVVNCSCGKHKLHKSNGNNVSQRPVGVRQNIFSRFYLLHYVIRNAQLKIVNVHVVDNCQYMLCICYFSKFIV